MSNDFRYGIVAGIIFSALVLWAVGTFGKLFAGETWIVGSIASHHFDGDRPRDYEQRNWGLGVEHELFRDFALVGGVYRNSIRRTSRYIGIAWAALTLARTELGDLKFGAAALRVDGYGPKPLLAAFPVVSLEKMLDEKTGIGANFPIVPKTKRNVTAIGLQIKVLW